ncbi:PAS domain S-box [Belliella baltica DSM 15883]|uniref:histidine kinase n=1 Tax=Belliella baltica (strain DSM 15883 / CIP 108006 / LMG 21964 / BA134) TaxID=866536 RepID=I3Z7C7_BELBD|nr:PAS domain S-box protein [Belliella baltica]AFL85145.1 PAS domain S-box [Belliella baltica DSM 15883]
MKSKSRNIFYKYPLLSGILVFVLITGLQYFTVKEYDLKISNENQRVKDYSNLIQKQISNAIASSISTTKVLKYIEENYGIDEGFDTIAAELLETNRFIDAIQLVEGGKIKFTYPLEGNENVIGYDILAEPNLRDEALKSIEKRQLYFAGPLKLKQGGIGIVGRNPIFKNNEFWGFAAVIMKFDSFLKLSNIDTSADNPFYVQFSKINNITGKEELFLPPATDDYTGFEDSFTLKEGDWKISVQLKESTAFREVLPFLILRVVLSAVLGFIAYYLTKLPSILNDKLDDRTRELKESNQRFEYASIATSDAIWDWDLTSGHVFRSSNFEKLFGHRIDKYTNNKDFWISQIHAEDYPEVERAMLSFQNGTDEFWESTFRFKKANGKYAYVLDKGIIIRDQDGKALRMIGATQDITAKKLAEKELENEREFLKSLMESLSEAIVACDENGKIIISNRAAREIHGMEVKETMPENWGETYDLYHKDGKTLLRKEEIPLYRAFRGEKIIEEEFKIIPQGESERTVLATGTPITSLEGKNLGAVVAMKDITKSKSNERELLQLSQELAIRARKLEISNTELEQFAYVASHDLQEPLRMITGFLNQLEVKYRNVLDEKAQKYIFFATDGAKRMRQIILDLLEYSRVGNYHEKEEEVAVDQILKNIIILNRRIINW